MRKTLDIFLNKLKSNDVYLLHCDMWPYDTHNTINCGIQEPNMVNIAAGLASQGKKVFIYGVAGFVLHKAYEQIKLNVHGFADKAGSIIFVNAGANGCYSFAGRGHCIDDDSVLCGCLGLSFFDPTSRSEFLKTIKEQLKSPGASFVRLGNDREKWK